MDPGHWVHCQDGREILIVSGMMEGILVEGRELVTAGAVGAVGAGYWASMMPTIYR